MPAYNSNPYDDAPEGVSGSMAADKPMAEQDREDESSPEAVLPKSILMGKKFEVGDEVVLKITRIGDEDISVMYSSEPEGEHDEPHKEMAESAGAPNPGTGMYD